MKKLNHALNIIIGAFVGLFIGYAIYVVWDYNAHPQLYAAQSAPWYTGTSKWCSAMQSWDFFHR